MKTSNEIGALSLALSQAQAEMTNVFKGKSGYNFNYADLGNVLEILRNTLPKYELAIMQTPSNDGANVCVTTLLSHSSGEWIKDSLSITVEVGKGNSFAQSVGSCITYLRRYQASAIAGIAQTDDDASIRTEADPDGVDAQAAELVRPISKVEVLAVKNKAEEAGVDIATVMKASNVTELNQMTSDQAERIMRKLHASIVKADEVASSSKEAEATNDEVQEAS